MPIANLAAVEQYRDKSLDRQQQIAEADRKRFKPGETEVIASVHDFTDNVLRVRLHQKRYAKGALQQRPFQITETTYLDGLQTVATNHKTLEETREYVTTPVRTKDVLDFGRLEMAAKALSSQMAAALERGPIDEAQQTVFVQGYQQLIQWDRDATSRLEAARGQIDIVGALVRKAMGIEA